MPLSGVFSVCVISFMVSIITKNVLFLFGGHRNPAGRTFHQFLSPASSCFIPFVVQRRYDHHAAERVVSFVFVHGVQ